MGDASTMTPSRPGHQGRCWGSQGAPGYWPSGEIVHGLVVTICQAHRVSRVILTIPRTPVCYRYFLDETIQGYRIWCPSWSVADLEFKSSLWIPNSVSLSPLNYQPPRHEQTKFNKAGPQRVSFFPKGPIFPQNPFPSKTFALSRKPEWRYWHGIPSPILPCPPTRPQGKVFCDLFSLLFSFKYT